MSDLYLFLGLQMLKKAILLSLFSLAIGCSDNSGGNHSDDMGKPGSDKADSSGGSSATKIDMDQIQNGVFTLPEDLSFKDASVGSDSTSSNLVNYSKTFINNQLVSESQLRASDSFCSITLELSKTTDVRDFVIKKNQKLKLLTVQKYESTSDKISQFQLAISYYSSDFSHLNVSCNNIFTVNDFNRHIGKIIEILPKGTVLPESPKGEDKPELPKIAFKDEIQSYKFINKSNVLIEKGEIVKFESFDGDWFGFEFLITLKNQKFVSAKQVSDQESYCQINNAFIRVLAHEGFTSKDLKKYYFFYSSESEGKYKELYQKVPGRFLGPYGTPESVQFSLDLRFRPIAHSSSEHLENDRGQGIIVFDGRNLKLTCFNTFTVEQVNQHIGNILEMSR